MTEPDGSEQHPATGQETRGKNPNTGSSI